MPNDFSVNFAARFRLVVASALIKFSSKDSWRYMLSFHRPEGGGTESDFTG
jgi:hypothetical protein